MIAPRALAWAGLCCVLGWQPLLAQLDVVKVDTNLPPVGSAVTALNWSDKSDLLHVGTINGEVFSFGARFPAGPKMFYRRAYYAGDPLAALTLHGDSNELLTGGIAASPQVALLPGSMLGTFHVTQDKLQGVATHFGTRRFALLTAENVIVIAGDPPQITATLPGKFTFVTWVDNTQDPAKPWLVAYAADTGALHIWAHAEGARKSLVVAPVKLTCAAPSNSADRLIAGDAAGNLRLFQLGLATHQPKPATADRAVYADNAQALVEHEGTKLRLRLLASGTTQETASKADPTSLAHQAVGQTHFAATAFPKMADKYEVRLTEFPNTNTTLSPHVAPSDEFQALAIHPAASQVAGANPKDGVVFFTKATQVPVMPEMDEDKEIVSLRYSADGNWLLAAGKFISLYKATDKKRSDQSLALGPMGSELLAADFELTGGANGDPPSGRVLLGWANGEVELIKLSIPSADMVEFTSLGKSLAAPADAIRSVVLRGDRGLVVEDKVTTTWQLLDDEPVGERLRALERFPTTESTITATVAAGDVLQRTTTALRQQSQSAVRAIACGMDPLTHLDQEGAIVAAASATTLHVFRDFSRLAVQSTDKFTALAIEPQAAGILSGVQNATGLLRRWKIEDSAVTGEAPFHLPADGSALTNIQFGKTPNDFVTAQSSGRITHFQQTADGERFPSRLPGANAPVLGLDWLPQFGMSPGPDFQRFLLVTENRFSLHALEQQAGAEYTTGEKSSAPWYAATRDPTGKRIAIAASDGHVWRADWPFPRRLKGYAFDNDKVPLQKVPPQPASPLPLYAVGWSNNYQTGNPLQASIITCGADGNLYQTVAGNWQTIAPKTAGHSALALTIHPTKPILAVGHGQAASQPAPDQLLSVWPKNLSAGSAVYWLGHSVAIQTVAFSPDGVFLASADRAGKLILWDCSGLSESNVAEPPSKTPPDLPPDPITSLVWLGTQNLLAVGYENGQVSIFKVSK